MNLQSIVAFVRAYEKHEICLNHDYYRTTTSRVLVLAYEALIVDFNIDIKLDVKASNAVDLLREAMGEMRDANGYMERALDELLVPLADSIVRLNPTFERMAPEPVVMAVAGVEYSPFAATYAPVEREPASERAAE